MSHAQTAMELNNAQTVTKVYEAFQRGDVAAIVALVADDVDWRNDGVESRECPWNGNFSGKANLPGFFAAVGAELNIAVFDVLTTVASGSHVAVNLHIESTLTKNGRSFNNDVV